jgi:hypothetical protein
MMWFYLCGGSMAGCHLLSDLISTEIVESGIAWDVREEAIEYGW